MYRPYYEIIQNGVVVVRGDQFLSEIDINIEIMLAPETTLTIPIYYKQFLYGRPEIKIFINGKIFHGLIYDPEENKIDETITLTIIHVINEWSNREVATNLAVKDRTISNMYHSAEFKYSTKWNIEFQDDSSSRIIDYVYSRQNYLDALTKTMELTNDLFWRVRLNEGRNIEIGKFGKKLSYTLSIKQSSEQNIRIIEEPIINNTYMDVINVATVYGTKNDSGMSSMSLREVHDDPTKQKKGFPVVILREGINNERDYTRYINEYPMLAPNNELEYAVIDEESLALEGGLICEGSYSFEDLSPFNTDGEIITDEDRIKASVIAYEKAIRRLIAARRDFSIEIRVEELPLDINVGDQIKLIYDNLMNLYCGKEDCTSYIMKILQYNEWFYITSIDTTIAKDGSETSVIRLDKYLRIERDGD